MAKLNGLLVIIVLLVVTVSTATADAKYSDIRPLGELIKDIQQGGHILYMRHGITHHKGSSRDKRQVDFSRCETQRNLSEEGTQQVEYLGNVFKSLEIPVASVYSSPYCRTKDTAKAVFTNFQVYNNLAFSISKEEEESRRLGQYLHDAMLKAKTTGGNAVFVGHTANLKDGLGVWPKPEGVTAVFKLEGEKIVFKGMIAPDEWPKPATGH